MLYDATHPKTIFTSSAPVPLGIQLVPESITMYQQLSDPYHVARVEATLALRNNNFSITGKRDCGATKSVQVIAVKLIT
jgi:hypothetical protein